MSTIKKYLEIRAIHPKLHECFFAFGNEQFERNRKAAGIPADKKLYSGGMGLYGTKEGLRRFFADTDAINARISAECDPQDVYDYEYDNHECGYVGNDYEAIMIVVSLFGERRSKDVKRRYAYNDIDELFRCREC